LTAQGREHLVPLRALLWLRMAYDRQHHERC
jgi:hypothetical protein